MYFTCYESAASSSFSPHFVCKPSQDARDGDKDDDIYITTAKYIATSHMSQVSHITLLSTTSMSHSCSGISYKFINHAFGRRCD